MLERVKKAVKTLPKVELGIRKSRLDAKAWTSYVFQTPNPTFSETCRPPEDYDIRQVYFDLDEKKYVFSRMYRCTNCEFKINLPAEKNPKGSKVSTFAAHHPGVLAQLPDFMKYELRFITPHKALGAKQMGLPKCI
ncbi:hypothetical protein CYMTET_29897 [Cymbomonas tetramitiformis]|uniref:Uncharacterized protein n=1 Tax=Cymbomonas tetramitiformis TaxID=36881 RepID=A0AAE0KUQ3_9CHLO|nr:hypothetical protein CYMTET_29897 [Cymbomonas tetramitiformis]